jgi:DNA-binding PadR family transcriptional regulator
VSKPYEQKLLADWEDIFRQGLLTFWVFLALSKSPQTVPAIRKEVERLSKGTYVAAEQTLYRLLRKQYDLELVDYKEVESKLGPKKKIYALSPLGSKLLHEFTNKNISLFYQKEVKRIIKEET